MKIYNFTGYSLILIHVVVAGLVAPEQWGFVLGAAVALLYLLFIWFLGGLYLSDVMHMGIAHKTLAYKEWFIKLMAILNNVAGIYINPITWVNRHRHHHAFSDHENDPNKLIPSNAKYSRYRKDKGGKYSFKGNNANHCWRLWHDPVITWDGAVVPCCFDKDAQHKLGNLKQMPFKELWQNKDYKNFRGQVLQSRKNIDICANCSEGVKVWG